MTVTGEVRPDQLGRTLIHEHVFAALPGFDLDVRDSLDDDEAVKTSVEVLRAAKEFGVQTVVDAAPLNWYRRPDLLERISEESEVFIVACTGLYTERMGWPFHFKLLSEVDLAEIFAIELGQGMSHSAIRAGVIKIASGEGPLGKYDQRAIVAAVTAQRATGAGIITHTTGPTGGLDQLRAIEDAGGDPSRVMIGHMDNVESARAVADRGAFVGMDRVGHYRQMSHDDRLGLILSMIELGYASQVLLSHDAVVYSKGRWFVAEDTPHWKHYGLTFLFREVLPRLREHGVSADVLDAMLIVNPRRVVAGIY